MAKSRTFAGVGLRHSQPRSRPAIAATDRLAVAYGVTAPQSRMSRLRVGDGPYGRLSPLTFNARYTSAFWPRPRPVGTAPASIT